MNCYYFYNIFSFKEQFKNYIKLTKIFVINLYHNNLYILASLEIEDLIMIKVLARCRSPGLLLTIINNNIKRI